MAIATGNPAAPAAGARPAPPVPRSATTGASRASERVLHAGLMLTFVGCALSGLPLLYADEPWAATLARILGGFESAGVIHRICASVMILVFSSHVAMLLSKAIARGGVLPLLWGPDSLVPQPQDVIDIVRNFKWFVGARAAAAVRPLDLLGEVRLLGGVLGDGDHRRLRARCSGSRCSSRSSCPAGCSTSRRWCTARRRCSPPASSSPSTSSTATCGQRSSRWTP